ncbi:MAG: hypothetical protein OXF41_02680 [bacterium]|nr:hypothetical protein [bacterium]
MDLTRRPAGKWIVDFGSAMSAGDAALYEEPFRRVQKHVYPMRQKNRRKSYREYWWRHVEPRPQMWAALDGLSRYIVTPCVAKHRLFVWLDARVCPDHALIVIARDDDTTFGILHSRIRDPAQPVPRDLVATPRDESGGPAAGTRRQPPSQRSRSHPDWHRTCQQPSTPPTRTLPL